MQCKLKPVERNRLNLPWNTSHSVRLVLPFTTEKIGKENKHLGQIIQTS